MSWLLFLVGIFADGSVQTKALAVYSEQKECLAQARDINALPDESPLMWSNAGCLQIPTPEPKKTPSKWVEI